MSTTTPLAPVWVVGSPPDDIGWLPDTAKVTWRFPTIAAALAQVHQLPPDVIVIFQHWSDEYRADEVQDLFTHFPLCRWLCSYGPLCGSDGRSRQVWPLAVRIPWSQTAVRIKAELAVVQGERAPLPLTAGYEEVFVFESSEAGA